MEQVQQELIRSNEMLSIQVWVLGGLVSFLLLVLIGIVRSGWGDVRKMLDDHENRITGLEKFQNRKEDLIDSHEKDIETHKTLIGQLQTSVATLTK